MQPKVKNFLGGIAAIVIGLICIGGFVLYAIDKVHTGHGLDYFFTGMGVQMNYLGALTTIVVAAVALFIGWLANFFYKKRNDLLFKGLKNDKRNKKEI
jgi:hypothetical protein